jgi:hypothetical protein
LDQQWNVPFDGTFDEQAVADPTIGVGETVEDLERKAAGVKPREIEVRRRIQRGLQVGRVTTPFGDLKDLLGAIRVERRAVSHVHRVPPGPAGRKG